MTSVALPQTHGQARQPCAKRTARLRDATGTPAAYLFPYNHTLLELLNSSTQLCRFFRSVNRLHGAVRQKRPSLNVMNDLLSFCKKKPSRRKKKGWLFHSLVRLRRWMPFSGFSAEYDHQDHARQCKRQADQLCNANSGKHETVGTHSFDKETTD